MSRGFFPLDNARRRPETHNPHGARLQLMLGDCLERMREIPDGSVDMVLCDLPYGTTNCAWDVVIPFEPLWAEYRRVCRERSAVALFADQPFASLLVVSNVKQFKHDWVWDKGIPSGFLNAKKEPMQLHEGVYIFGSTARALRTYSPIKEKTKKATIHRTTPRSNIYGKLNHDGRVRIYNETYPKTILRFGKYQKHRLHPSQKPVPLLAYLIRTYTQEGETVLDNCMGSGSTGVACCQTNRHFVGIEKDPEYYRVACDRLGVARQSPLPDNKAR